MNQSSILRTLSIFLISIQLFASENSLKPNYSFTNVSINYLNWTDGTEFRSFQNDFTYLEIEGGAGWDWGDFYMFLDIENPINSYSNDSPNDMRFAFKPVLDIKLVNNLALYIQDYNLKSKSFYVNNLVLGLSYKINTDFGLWIKPFIGPHYQMSTYYSGMNGYMAGWVFDYKFDILKNKFSLAQWHEYAFKRSKADGYARDTGNQGSISFWWHSTDKITTGLQYRYASYNLGTSAYQAGIIYSFKYNF